LHNLTNEWPQKRPKNQIKLDRWVFNNRNQISFEIG
jgi:hypothetical protein